MTSTSPPAIARPILVAEVAVYMAALFGYVWFGLPAHGQVRVLDVSFYVFASLFPVCTQVWHRDRLKEIGLRIDNLLTSARDVAIATGIMAGIVAIVGFCVGGFHSYGLGALSRKLMCHVIWGLVQQYLMCGFILVRLRQAGLRDLTAVLCTASLFSAAHSPNWLLTALTAITGIVFCTLFVRRPNLLTLGFAHAVLALTLYHAWPSTWHQNLTVGGVYVSRLSENAAAERKDHPPEALGQKQERGSHVNADEFQRK